MKTPRLAFADILYLHNRIDLNIYFASVINVLTFLFLIFFLSSKKSRNVSCFWFSCFLEKQFPYIVFDLKDYGLFSLIIVTQK